MHYKDGTPAQIGDVVKGRGYNIDRDIVGTVIGLTPGSDSCNIQVAHVIITMVNDERTPQAQGLYEFFEVKGVVGCGPEGGRTVDRVLARVALEYGQCDRFEKVA